jgi:AbrB family looped-hinge helix DNA binding protein
MPRAARSFSQIFSARRLPNLLGPPCRSRPRSSSLLKTELTLAFICYPTGSSRIFRISVNHRTLSNALVKVQPKGQMTIPRRVRSAVGLIDGDLVEVRAIGKRIIVTPQLVIDRSKFPTADDEYTPEQRRIVTARLNKAEKGPFFGPFKNGVEVAAFLKRKARSAARFAKTKIR